MFEKNIIELKKITESANAIEAQEALNIITAITKQKVIKYLQGYEKEIGLYGLYDTYEKYSSKERSEIIREHKEDGLKGFKIKELLIRCYFLEYFSGGKKINFEKYAPRDFKIISLDITPVETDNEWFADMLDRRPTKRRNLTIPEHAETTVIPTGKYRGSKFKNDRAPYMIRPMECLSPQSNIPEVRLMWSAQTGKNTVGEQAVLYYIEEVPSEILYVTSDERQARKWLEKRIAPRASRAGIEFRAQTDSKASRRSGDTMYSKEFDGGNLDAASARSPAQLASETKRFVMADETDRWKAALGPEGFTWDIMYARTQAWGDQKKIFAISTPTTYEESMIWPLFEEGTREEYFVPCPHCGEYQMLVIEQLKYEMEGRAIKNDHVWYECEHCNEHIEESKKYELLNKGEWRAQATPAHPGIVSFHINAIYSPFKQWEEIAREYERAKEDPVRMHTFTNLVLGLPFRELGTRPKIEQIIELRGTYRSGEVPNEVLWITAGADVQRGKKAYEQLSDADLEKEMERLEEEGKVLWISNLPRIEIEILGHSHGYRTYSIEYKVFYGHTTDPYGGAWEKLRSWMEETELMYYRLDGSKIGVSRVFIDSGDGERTDTVYRFCEPYPGVYPIKGDQVLKKGYNEKGDELMLSNFKRYSVSKIGDTQYLYTIATNHYKNKLYASLKIPRIEGDEQRPGFCEFPRNYPDYYFKMLTAEEKRLDGSFHAGGRPCESEDCRIYALCAGDVWLDNQVNAVREGMVKNGKTRKQAQQEFTHKRFIEILKKKRYIEMGKVSIDDKIN